MTRDHNEIHGSSVKLIIHIPSKEKMQLQAFQRKKKRKKNSALAVHFYRNPLLEEKKIKIQSRIYTGIKKPIGAIGFITSHTQK